MKVEKMERRGNTEWSLADHSSAWSMSNITGGFTIPAIQRFFPHW